MVAKSRQGGGLELDKNLSGHRPPRNANIHSHSQTISQQCSQFVSLSTRNIITNVDCIFAPHPPSPCPSCTSAVRRHDVVKSFNDQKMATFTDCPTITCFKMLVYTFHVHNILVRIAIHTAHLNPPLRFPFFTFFLSPNTPDTGWLIVKGGPKLCDDGGTN